jgi:hypothetical protein
MLIIGNGESRKDIDINNWQGTRIGCNAIHRDFAVEHLVCVDRRMVQQAIEASYAGNLYTRQDWASSFSNVKIVPKLPYKGKERWDEPFQWGSGPYAVLLGAKFSKKCTMIGFDLFSETKKVNNIYKGTKGYDTVDKHAVDPRYWIHQIAMVFKCFPKNKFKIYCKKEWNIPETWKLNNVSLDNIDNFKYNK